MVRRRLPSSTYYTPAGEPEWSRETFGEQSIAVPSGGYRNPIEMARHVAARCGSHQPFFVMDVAAIERRLEALRVFLPRIRPSYAVACNADPLLARVLANNTDVTFEVANATELEMARDHVESTRAVFCSQLMTRKAIRTAAAAGCGTFVVESEKQLTDVMNASPEAEILLAVCLPYTTGEVPFGCAVEEVEELLDMAHLLGANLTGIYLELGVRAKLDDYISAISDARSIFDTATEKFLTLSHLSLGNLVIPMGSNNISAEFRSFCSTLSHSIKDLFHSDVEVSANIGRSLVMNAFTLCTNVIGKRMMEAKSITHDDFDDGIGYVYQTNDGVYGSFGCKQMDINPLCKPLDAAKASDKPTMHFGTILGPSLDRTDVALRLTKCRQLEVGEWLVWEQMGAFTIPVESEHPVPPVYYYSGKECWQQLIHKDEQRRSPSPSVSDMEDIGSDGEGYASSCDDSEADTALEPLVEEMYEFEGSF